MSDTSSIITFHVHELIESRRRHCLFSASAKRNDDGTWRIHAIGDYSKNMSVDSTENPTLDMHNLYTEWKTKISQ